jgi:hypothetical protein
MPVRSLYSFSQCLLVEGVVEESPIFVLLAVPLVQKLLLMLNKGEPFPVEFLGSVNRGLVQVLDNMLD